MKCVERNPRISQYIQKIMEKYEFRVFVCMETDILITRVKEQNEEREKERERKNK